MNENLEPETQTVATTEPLPVEEQISQELVKYNVTEAKIAELKEKYLPLQINGTDDKETYLIVKEARKECKSLRVAAEKICKFGREEANKISKAWVAKEKDVARRIGEVEDHLEKQEKEFEAAVAKEKEERKRKIEEQFIHRNAELNKMGVLYTDGNYFLGEVSFEMSLVKECEPEIWEESILPKFKEEHEKAHAEELEKERIKKEKEDEFKRQQEEFEQKQRELAEKEAALKAAQEEQERKQREEEEKKAAEVKAARDAKQKARIDQLSALGLKYDYNDNHFKGYGCFVPHLDIQCDNDEVWAKKVEKMTDHVAKVKEEEEQKRVAEIEAQKEAERVKALRSSRIAMLRQYGHTYEGDLDLGKYPDADWNSLLEEVKSIYDKEQREKWEQEQEEKRQLEEQKKAEELLQATEKQKWADIISQVNAIEIHEFKSGQYRKRATELRKLLDQIKAL